MKRSLHFCGNDERFAAKQPTVCSLLRQEGLGLQILGLPFYPSTWQEHVESLLSFVRVHTRECWTCIVSSISRSSIPFQFGPLCRPWFRASHPKATTILLYWWMRFGSSTQHVAGWHNTILRLLLLQEVFVVQTQPDWCHSESKRSPIGVTLALYMAMDIFLIDQSIKTDKM